MLVRNMRLVLSYKPLYNDKFVFSIIQMSSFMQPISFARSFLSKGLSKSVWKASVVSKVLQPAILIGVLGCAISVNAQAAVGASTNSDNPTNGLQLISLNADEIADEKDADNLSNIADMLDVADEPDDSILIRIFQQRSHKYR